MKILKKSETALSQAISILNSGGVIICPTDTVYGFLADALNKKAVDKIYKIKRRSKSKPLPVFVSSIKMARELAEIDEKQEKVLKKYWPGAYTFVLKRKSGIKLYGIDKNTIALRIPKHAFLQKLIKKVNRPLVQTSVNISDKKTLKNAEQIVDVFGKNKMVELIIDSGNSLNRGSSKIVDLIGKRMVKLR